MLVESQIKRTIDFELTIDQNLSIPRLVLNNEILSSLDQAYSMGTMISTPLGESNLGLISRLL